MSVKGKPACHGDEMPGSGEPLFLYRLLRSRFGFLDWWPGDTKEEVFVGAILTQQTSWKNVEKAISNLKGCDAVSIEKIASMDLHRLEQLVRPSGYYRQKAMRLKQACSYIINSYGSLDSFFRLGGSELRLKLLSIKGIGPETADSIALYAAGKPSFVIDAYTKRIMHRIYGTSEGISYEELKAYFERSLGEDAELYNDFHAQFVELGKRYCRAKPLCSGCPACHICAYAKNVQNINPC